MRAKPQASAEFKERVREWSRRLRVSPRQIRVARMTRKWASCSTRGWCTFAADLVDEPGGFQDYVIVHELLHLKVRNHGRVFRSLLTAYVPGWRKYCSTGLGTSCASIREGASTVVASDIHSLGLADSARRA